MAYQRRLLARRGPATALLRASGDSLRSCSLPIRNYSDPPPANLRIRPAAVVRSTPARVGAALPLLHQRVTPSRGRPRGPLPMNTSTPVAQN